MGISMVRKPIVAVDFDGLLVEDRFPLIGRVNTQAVETFTNLYERVGLRIIIWTCRVGLHKKMALKFLDNFNFPYECCNQNVIDLTRYLGLPAFCRKVYADYYLDDKNFGIDPWSQEFWDAFYDHIISEWGKKNLMNSK